MNPTDQEEKPTKPSKDVRGHITKGMQLLEKALQSVQQTEAEVRAEDLRVRAIISTAIPGGGLENFLRTAPIVDEAGNRKLLRRKGWRV